MLIRLLLFGFVVCINVPTDGQIINFDDKLWKSKTN